MAKLKFNQSQQLQQQNPVVTKPTNSLTQSDMASPQNGSKSEEEPPKMAQQIRKEGIKINKLTSAKRSTEPSNENHQQSIPVYSKLPEEEKADDSGKVTKKNN